MQETAKDYLKKLERTDWYKYYDKALEFCIEKDSEYDFDFGIIDSEFAEEFDKECEKNYGLFE